MDVSRYLEVQPAPRAVFDRLDERRSRPRFMVLGPSGDWSAVTWGAYARQIREIAAFLRSVRIEPGERVALFGHNSVAWAASALAVQAAGGVVVPIYPGNTSAQAAYVIEHSKAAVVFVDGQDLLGRLFDAWPRLGSVRGIVTLSDALDPLTLMAERRTRGESTPAVGPAAARFTRWSEAMALGAALDAESPHTFEQRLRGLDLDRPGLMLYTSGTTGNPKGVPLTHRNVGVNGCDWLRCLGSQVPEDGVDLLSLPFSHIFGFGELCLGNTLGWTSYLADPWTVLQRLPEVRPSIFMGVPSYWEKLSKLALAEDTPAARHERLRAVTGGNLEFCLSGGAGLSRPVKELFLASGMLILEGYGLTECSPTLTLNRPDDYDFDTVGKPLPSLELKLAADGEILARGPNVFAGYHDDPAATRDAFTPDGWLKTGDVGVLTARGFIRIVDRKKEILVTAGGKNVPPQNIELRFRGDPLFDHAVVYGDGKRYLVAGFWLNAKEAERRLRQAAVAQDSRRGWLHELVERKVQQVNQSLARHETIKRFALLERPLTVEAGLVTPSLKVRRKAVYEAFRGDFEAMYEGRDP